MATMTSNVYLPREGGVYFERHRDIYLYIFEISTRDCFVTVEYIRVVLLILRKL